MNIKLTSIVVIFLLHLNCYAQEIVKDSIITNKENAFKEQQLKEKEEKKREKTT